MKVRVKKLNPNAVVPSYAKPGDAGLDLTAISTEGRPFSDIVEYGTGLSFEIPSGFVGLIFPRSSIYKTNLSLSNAVGVVDSGFRGEVKFKFRVQRDFLNNYKVGDRVGQMIIIPVPTIELEEVDELSSTERGNSGFGSSGN